jgi:GH24 family phage-related lysozyme (muramidase)
MLTKKWFDRRAVAGGKWAVIVVGKTRLEYVMTSFKLEVIEEKRYVACPLLNIPNEVNEVIRNDLTKDEAMAMEKFLNFNEGNKV